MTDQPPAEPAKPTVTAENVVDGYKLPAPFVNKSVFTAQGAAQQVRITLYETYNDTNLNVEVTAARVAFVMPIQDLLALRDLISNFEKNNLQQVTVRIGPDGQPIITPG